MTSVTAMPDPSGALRRATRAHFGSYPATEGAQTLGSRQRSRSAQRDRAQTMRRAARASAWREGKLAGWPAPAV
jgi:hypothetical protein